MSSVGAHWPTNTLALCFPLIWSVAEAPMAVIAAQRNVSDGNLAVCDSVDFAICPSVCSRRTADAIAMCRLLGSATTNVPDVMVRGRLRFYQHACQWTRFGPSRFRFRHLSSGDCEQCSNDLEISVMRTNHAITRELFRRASEATARGGRRGRRSGCRHHDGAAC